MPTIILALKSFIAILPALITIFVENSVSIRKAIQVRFIFSLIFFIIMIFLCLNLIFMPSMILTYWSSLY
jgi:hypothetical protein